MARGEDHAYSIWARGRSASVPFMEVRRSWKIPASRHHGRPRPSLQPPMHVCLPPRNLPPCIIGVAVTRVMPAHLRPCCNSVPVVVHAVEDADVAKVRAAGAHIAGVEGHLQQPRGHQEVVADTVEVGHASTPPPPGRTSHKSAHNVLTLAAALEVFRRPLMQFGSVGPMLSTSLGRWARRRVRPGQELQPRTTFSAWVVTALSVFVSGIVGLVTFLLRDKLSCIFTGGKVVSCIVTDLCPLLVGTIVLFGI